MSAGVMNYHELSQEIDLYTGGMSAGVHVSSNHTDTTQFEKVRRVLINWKI